MTADEQNTRQRQQPGAYEKALVVESEAMAGTQSIQNIKRKEYEEAIIKWRKACNIHIIASLCAFAVLILSVIFVAIPYGGAGVAFVTTIMGTATTVFLVAIFYPTEPHPQSFGVYKYNP